MNAAFHRSDAVETLEDLSLIILIHLALIETFPKDRACAHWQGEINAFAKTLKRYDNGKKGRHNYVDENYVTQILCEMLDDSDEQKRIETHIFSKGYDLSSTEINFEAVKGAVVGFSKLVF